MTYEQYRELRYKAFHKRADLRAIVMETITSNEVVRDIVLAVAESYDSLVDDILMGVLLTLETPFTDPVAKEMDG